MDLNSLLGNYATEETLASGGREVGGNGAPSDAGPEAAARPSGSDAPPPDDDDVNIDLLPGEDIIPVGGFDRSIFCYSKTIHG